MFELHAKSRTVTMCTKNQLDISAPIVLHHECRHDLCIIYLKCEPRKMNQTESEKALRVNDALHLHRAQNYCTKFICPLSGMATEGTYTIHTT